MNRIYNMCVDEFNKTQKQIERLQEERKRMNAHNYQSEFIHLNELLYLNGLHKEFLLDLMCKIQKIKESEM